jgi:tRNA-modifying protein YgfZ
VAAAWGEGAGEALKASASIAFQDPRLGTLGFRGLAGQGEAASISASLADYEAMRIAAAVPEGGKDYAYGDAFPHEACFDLLHGVSFTKGCYVGQEVVSRMQHRGTARTRVLAVSGETPLPVGGVDILAEGFAVGRLGSVAGTRGVALVRLDRAGEALAKGAPLSAGGIAVTLSVPAWASYTLDSAGGEVAR